MVVIELSKWVNGPQTVEAVRIIRTHSNLGLKKNSKKLVEDCLVGNSPHFKAADLKTAERLLRELEDIGLEARLI